MFARRLTLAGVASLAAVLAAPSGAPAAPAASSAAPHTAALDLPGAGEPARVAQRRPRVLRTPGYDGSRRVPRTRTPAPPAPVSIGTGEKPDVLVDEAGTAHIVWNEDRIGEVPDITHYCRLKRGATACDNPNPTPMPIDIPYASDDGGPKILQLGNQLVVISHRYPPVTRQPDGEDRDRTTYAWTSSDGGTTWTGPGVVGTTIPSGDAALVGGAGNPKIAVITASFTGGTYLQVLDAGAFTPTRILLGPGDDAYDGTVAPEGDGIVAAFAGLGGGITVRRSGAGDITDPNTWSAARIGGELPRLAGGPRGTFLLSRERTWNVRNVTGGNPGPPTTISPADVAQTRAFTQDPSGRLHAAFSTAGSPQRITLRTSDDGASWRGGFEASVANSIDDLQLGAAADGGGMLIQRRDPTGTFNGTIAATAFGTLSPTGRPGAGALAGGGIPGGFAGCRQAGFGAVKLSPNAGCLLESVDPRYPGAFVSNAEVDLNGLILKPVGSTRIVFDPRRRRLDTTGRVQVILRGPAIGDIVLVETELHAELGSQAGQSLLKGIRLPAGPKIKGFPVDADFDIKISGDGVTIPISVKLPPSLGSLSASATLRAQTGRGAVLESFRISLGRIPLGPLELEGLVVDYDGTAERWTGTAGLKLPLGALKLSLTFERGAFTSGLVDLRFPRPGILVFPKVYFTGVTGDFRPQPLTIGVGASFGAIYTPPPADVFVAELDGRLQLAIRNGAAEFTFTGREKLLGIPVGTGTATATTDGYAAIAGGFDLDLAVVSIDAQAQLFVDGPSSQFGGTYQGSTRLFGIPVTGLRGAVSRRGVGGCVVAPPLPPKTITETNVGIGFAWDQGIPDGLSLIFGEDCDLSAYTVPPPVGRAAQAGGGQGFTLPGGLRGANVELRGEGGAPAVDVVAPDGTRVTPGAPAAGAKVAAVELPELGRTVIVLDDPAAGAWQVVPREGSPAITRLAVARSVEPVRVTGSVRRTTRGRELRYRVTGPPGTRVAVTERSSAGVRPLGVIRRGRGVLRFTSPPGPAGTRTLVGTPEGEPAPATAPRTIASYRTAATWRPAAPRRVTVRGTRVTWTAVPAARRYLVRARLANGRTVARQTRARSLRVPGATRRIGVRSASVAVVDRYGRTSVTRRGTARRR